MALMSSVHYQMIPVYGNVSQILYIIMIAIINSSITPLSSYYVDAIHRLGSAKTLHHHPMLDYTGGQFTTLHQSVKLSSKL